MDIKEQAKTLWEDVNSRLNNSFFIAFTLSWIIQNYDIVVLLLYNTKSEEILLLNLEYLIENRTIFKLAIGPIISGAFISAIFPYITAYFDEIKLKAQKDLNIATVDIKSEEYVKRTELYEKQIELNQIKKNNEDVSLELANLNKEIIELNFKLESVNTTKSLLKDNIQALTNEIKVMRLKHVFLRNLHDYYLKKSKENITSFIALSYFVKNKQKYKDDFDLMKNTYNNFIDNLNTLKSIEYRINESTITFELYIIIFLLSQYLISVECNYNDDDILNSITIKLESKSLQSFDISVESVMESRFYIIPPPKL